MPEPGAAVAVPATGFVHFHGYDPVVAKIEMSPELIALEETAWTEIQTGALTVESAMAVQAAVVAFAEEHGHRRIDVEAALKKHVRHPTTTP